MISGRQRKAITFTVLGICLSVIENRAYAGTDRFGVFRP